MAVHPWYGYCATLQLTARVASSQPDALEEAMGQWLAVDGPAILDVKVNRMELIMPPKIEADQVASTALFGLKAVLNGRVNEVIALLRSNFLK